MLERVWVWRQLSKQFFKILHFSVLQFIVWSWLIAFDFDNIKRNFRVIRYWVDNTDLCLSYGRYGQQIQTNSNVSQEWHWQYAPSDSGDFKIKEMTWSLKLIPPISYIKLKGNTLTNTLLPVWVEWPVGSEHPF